MTSRAPSDEAALGKQEPTTVGQGRYAGSISRLLEATRVVPWEAEAETWRFTYVGPQAANLLGYPIQAWYEKDFWVSRLHPDDRDTALNFCSRASAACRDYEFEYRMVSAGGESVWIHDLVSVEAEQGVPKILRGFLIDMTARKRIEAERQAAENRLRRLFELAPDAIIVTDADGRIESANRQAEELFGYRQEDFADVTVEQLMPARFRTGHLADRQHYVTAPSVRRMGRRPSELMAVRKSGEEFPVAISLGPLETEGGTLIISTIRDTTEQRRLEIDAAQQREALAHAARVITLGELLAALAHELNQPLTAILSNAQTATRVLDQDPLDVDELREILSDIIDNDRRAGNTVSQVRAMMKHDRARRELVDVNAQIRLTVNMVRSELLIKNVTVGLELDPTTPRISGDPIQIQQVVLNLVMNAVDAVAEREREARNVTLSSQYDESNVIVSVRDSGQGIVETALPRLFDSFVTTKPGGLGMGLSICRSLVEAHGGRVWVADTSSTGTTLRFALPIEEGGQP